MKKFLFNGFILFFTVAFISIPFSQDKSSFNIKGFSSIPVLHAGRVQPLDTFAAELLKQIHGCPTVKTAQGTLSPVHWILNVVTNTDQADSYAIFRLHSPALLGYFSLSHSPRYISFTELQKKRGLLQQLVNQSRSIPPELRNAMHRDILNLDQNLHLYQALKKGFDTYHPLLDIYSMPPLISELSDWLTVEDAENTVKNPRLPQHPGAGIFKSLLNNYQQGKALAFNQGLPTYLTLMKSQIPQIYFQSKIETFFNQYQFFYKALLIYLTAALIICLSWRFKSRFLTSLCHYMVLLGFTVHTVGIAFRIRIESMPPVNSLYSSVIVTAWITVLAGLFIENRLKNRMGITAAALNGFCLMTMSHYLLFQSKTFLILAGPSHSMLWLLSHFLFLSIGFGLLITAAVK